MAKISSEEDVNRISKLRQEVSDIITSYYDTDFNLLRWIKGLNYNIDEAKVKLRNHLEFRRSQWQLDTIANGGQDHPINKHWQTIITGSSGKIPNTIVTIEQTGVTDFWRILHTYPINEILKARLYYLELMLRRVMEQETKTAEHYVELVHSFVVVNAPIFISIMWKIFSPILPTQTRNKVKILGSDWREEILELANPDVLPSHWNLSEKDPAENEVDIHPLTLEIFEAHGKTFSLYLGTRPVIISTDIEFIQEIAIKQFSNFSSRIEYSFQNVFPMNESLLHVGKHGPRGYGWKEIRLIASQFFTSVKMHQIFPIVYERIQTLANVIEMSLGEGHVLDIYKYIYLECLRLRPPSIFFMSRQCVNETVVQGYRIPAGVMIIIPAIGVNWSPDYWLDPVKFEPERLGYKEDS
uniref:CRAL-TRIO domain-containing protein n=1 Tax=Acrobeloides nanus TaxID=290746 RepID=A0A914DLD9_9BILA